MSAIKVYKSRNNLFTISKYLLISVVIITFSKNIKYMLSGNVRVITNVINTIIHSFGKLCDGLF